MKNIYLLYLYCSILVFSLIICWHKLLGKRINFKSYKIYITLVLLTIISVYNYFLVNKFIKISIITIVFMFFFRFLFKENLKKCIITPIYYQIIIMLSEGICIMFLVSFLKLNINELKDQFLATFIVNAGTALFSIIIVYLPFVQKLYLYIINSINRINKKIIAFFSIVVLGFANILAMITYYEVDLRALISINIAYTLFCFFVVLYLFSTQNKYNKVSDKYNVAINSLRDYENMMSKYRIENHENKNLLLTIRAMIIDKEKDIPKYIDSIVKDKYDDNEKLLQKINIIPSGGLRATIYSEILKIQNNNISYTLNIDRHIKVIDLIELDTNTIIDACKIIGVFIDNAIEEVNNLSTKNICIELYIEDEFLNIKVSNNYGNKINVDKIFDDGYTTKGEGHGYGLSLVKKIIESSELFKNKVEINNKIFSQILSIQFKKKKILK